MGTHAERVAIKAEVSREDQDRFALDSHQRAIAAIDEGRFKDEIVPVPIQRGKEQVLFDTDEGPRRDSSIEALARLKPVFALPDPEPDSPPACPTARSPPATRRASRTAPPRPWSPASAPWSASASSRSRASSATARPRSPPSGCSWRRSRASRSCSRSIEMPIEAFDLIEINEAFAAQVLADGRELGFDWSKVNVNGGAIALGHPIGASGARIVATLLHELRRRRGSYGLATLCLGGGGSVAMAFERV